MNWYNIVGLVILFILVSYLDVATPFKSKILNITFQTVVFLVGAYILKQLIQKINEGFNPDTRIDQPCPEGSVKHRNGDCRMKGEGEAP